MKVNVRKMTVFAGTLVIALVLGMTLAGCSGNDRAIIGTWETSVWGSTVTFIFHRDGRAEVIGGGSHEQGTFSARNGQIFFFDDDGDEDGVGTYTITGNTLVLTLDGDTLSLQRQ